jgi:thiol-disulfide isomerase/thioredoxin
LWAAVLAALSLSASLGAAQEDRPGTAPAPAITPAAAPDTTGFDPARHAGRVVYLDFWASWCSPCKLSFPWMQEIADTYGARGLEVIAVNLDKKRAAADEFLRGMDPRFAVVFDPEGKLAARYQLQGMPTAILFDRSGTVRATHIGFQKGDRKALISQIEGLLAEPMPEVPDGK